MPSSLKQLKPVMNFMIHVVYIPTKHDLKYFIGYRTDQSNHPTRHKNHV